MSVYRIHFSHGEEHFRLKAETVDLTHPCFVTVQKLLLPEQGKLINPADDALRRRFDGVRSLMIPLQHIALVEEFLQNPDRNRSARQEASIIEMPDQNRIK